MRRPIIAGNWKMNKTQSETVKLLNEGEDIFENLTSFKGQFQILFKALKASNKKTK